MFTPLSTLAFSTLLTELRTDAAGLYNLMRQLGCAAGVAVMTAFLQTRIEAEFAKFTAAVPGAGAAPGALLTAAKLAAYLGSFRVLGIVTALLIPGLLLFRRIPPAAGGSAGS
jgi:DHA2 family multidrug resistance protein